MNVKSITQNCWVVLLRQTVNEWLDDGALRLSAALAYYSIFSIAPLLIIVIGIAGLALGDEAVKSQLDDQLRGYVGAQAAEGIQSLVQGAAKPTEGWMGAITGFFALLIGASGVFGQLKDALNTIWEVKAKKGGGILSFVRERLLTFGMVLVIGFLLLSSLVMSAALAALSSYLNHLLGVPPNVWAAISFIVSVALVTALFAFIFKVLPDAKVAWKDVWIGAGATALLFEAGKFGLAFYLGRESTASAYGAAASVVLLLLWIYYASAILLFGAEFTQVYARAAGRIVEPSANAVSTDETPKLAEPGEDEMIPAIVHQSHSLSEVKVVAVKSPEEGNAISPATVFLGTMAASFVIGLVTRRRLFDK